MSDEEVQKWKLRERSLAIGIVVWALLVSAMLTIAPDALLGWAIRTDPLTVAGSILITIGLWAGFAHFVHSLFDRWAEPNASEDLTEVPWNE